MCGIVVNDEMDIELAWHSGLDLVGKLAELGSTVVLVALAGDPSGRDVGVGEQRSGAEPFV